MNLDDRQAFTFGLTYIIFRRWVMTLVTFFIVLFLFLFAAYLITPTWEAEVLLLAEWRPLAVSPLGENSAASKADDAAENLALMLGGKALAYDMVKKYGLDERQRLRAQEPPTFRDWAKITIVKTMMSPILFLQWVGLMDTPEIDWVDAAAEDFREGLLAWEDIEALEDSQVVSLKINGETPALATEIANSMVKRVRERLTEATARSSDETRESQAREVERVRKQLAEVEAKLQAFEEDQGGVTLTEDTKAKTLKLQELNAADSQLREEIAVLGRQLQEAARNPDMIVSINSNAIADSKVVQDLRSSLHAKEVKLASLLTERTEQHPDVLNLREEIAGVRDAVGTEIANVHRGLMTDQTRTQAEIAELQAELLKLPQRERALAELTLSVDTYRHLYRDVLLASEEMAVLANSASAALDFKVLDYAYVSPLAQSDMPDWLIVLSAGIPIAIGAAFALVLFLEYWRDPIKGPSDLWRNKIEVLGVVPRVS